MYETCNMRLFDIYYSFNKYDIRVFRHKTKKKCWGWILPSCLLCCFVAFVFCQGQICRTKSKWILSSESERLERERRAKITFAEEARWRDISLIAFPTIWCRVLLANRDSCYRALNCFVAYTRIWKLLFLQLKFWVFRFFSSIPFLDVL